MTNRYPSDRWRSHLLPALLPRGMDGWLRDRGSLTARIRARCTSLSVRVLRQGLAPVQADEAPLLGLLPGDCAWVREVLLLADGVPVVFARSVLPRANVRGGWRLFAAIGSRPLGEALFADPRIARGSLACARIDHRDARHRAASAAVPSRTLPAQLWGRRSVFHRKGRSLLVTEIFLPTILDLPA